MTLERTEWALPKVSNKATCFGQYSHKLTQVRTLIIAAGFGYYKHRGLWDCWLLQNVQISCRSCVKSIVYTFVRIFTQV